MTLSLSRGSLYLGLDDCARANENESIEPEGGKLAWIMRKSTSAGSTGMRRGVDSETATAAPLRLGGMAQDMLELPTDRS